MAEMQSDSSSTVKYEGVSARGRKHRPDFPLRFGKDIDLRLKYAWHRMISAVVLAVSRARSHVPGAHAKTPRIVRQSNPVPPRAWRPPRYAYRVSFQDTARPRKRPCSWPA